MIMSIDMNSEKIKILYSFENDKIILLEVKNLTHPASCAKNLIYKWVVFNKQSNTFSSLNFQSMSQDKVEDREFQVRVFDEAELKFDQSFARFIFDDTMHLLNNIDQIPPSMISMLELFIIGRN